MERRIIENAIDDLSHNTSMQPKDYMHSHNNFYRNKETLTNKTKTGTTVAFQPNSVKLKPKKGGKQSFNL